MLAPAHSFSVYVLPRRKSESHSEPRGAQGGRLLSPHRDDMLPRPIGEQLPLSLAAFSLRITQPQCRLSLSHLPPHFETTVLACALSESGTIKAAAQGGDTNQYPLMPRAAISYLIFLKKQSKSSKRLHCSLKSMPYPDKSLWPGIFCT